MRSRTRRRRTARYWCAPGRSACAAPIARSSRAPTARLRPDEERLVLGHESLGEVEAAPKGGGFAPGDLVVGIVRRPDPGALPGLRRRRVGHVPQRPLHRARHQGPARLSAPSASASSPNSPSRSTRIWARSACCSSPPASSPRHGTTPRASAGARSAWKPTTMLVTGAGPIGLLAALMGVQRGLEVHVLDHNDERSEAAAGAGASAAIFTSAMSRGSGRLRARHPDGMHRRSERHRDVLGATAPAGIVCLLGVTEPGH